MVLLLAAPRLVSAHPEPFSWITLHLEAGGIRGGVMSHVAELGRACEVPPESLRVAGFLDRNASRLQASVGSLLRLRLDGAQAMPQWNGCVYVPERDAVAFSFELAGVQPARIDLHGPLYASDPAHQTYFNVFRGSGVVHQAVLDRDNPSSTFATGVVQSSREVVRRFVAEGVHHIFIGPDHILFVVGLMLLGGRVRRLLEIVTAFTVAHSITLALAATGLVTPPARIVEPVIALSIVCVGVDNLRRSVSGGGDRRAVFAACFGLVHGFGFANVLRELGLPREALAWSLFSFNVGVEIGQACIVLAVVPLLGFLGDWRPALSRRVVGVGSTGVAVAGAFWFVQRAFFG